MKISLVTVAVAALLLSACGKETPKPAPQAAPEAPKAEAPATPAAAAPAAVSDEDKAKAMEAAKAAAVLGRNYPESKWYERSYKLIEKHFPGALKAPVTRG